jgi:hypothetical protein
MTCYVIVLTFILVALLTSAGWFLWKEFTRE